MSSKYFAYATIAIALAISGNARAGQGLCTPNEKVFLSCKVKTGKTLSVCGSANFSQNEGYLQYRYGRQNAVELTFPEIERDSLSKFKWRTDPHAGVEANWLIFYRSKFQYTVFAIHDSNTLSGRVVHRYGVIVVDPKDNGSTIPCVAEVSSSLEDLASVLPLADDNE
jgi:hypothetical protein